MDPKCIVQDVKEDYKREAATMANVYRNCVVEARSKARPSNVSCHLFSVDGEDFSVIGKEFRHTGELPDEWPLYERGWVFQERVLPSRTIKFGPFPAWECRKMKIDKFNLVPPILDPREQWRFEDKLLCREFHSLSPGPQTGKEEERMYRFWQETRDHYSDLSLSKPTDRLVAIQGLMTAVARYTKWQLACGLLDDLLRELQWSRAPMNIRASHSRLRPGWS